MAQTVGRRAGGVVAAALVLVVLAACGSSDKGSSSAGGQASSTTAAPATTVAATTTTTAAPLLKTANNDKLGVILVDSTGKALYMFDRDTSSTSTCTGGCATTWPALLLPGGVPAPTATGVTGTLAVSPRPDGAGSHVTLHD